MRPVSSLLVFLLLSTLPALAQQAAPASNPLAGDAAAVERGKGLFNETCAHCHGPNAISPQAERNLRRLRARYSDKTPEVYHTTVTQGRPELGMPPWRNILDDKTIWSIFTYLETVQEAP